MGKVLYSEAATSIRLLTTVSKITETDAIVMQLWKLL
jgi:hypothetical protein